MNDGCCKSDMSIVSMVKPRIFEVVFSGITILFSFIWD